MMVGFVNEIWKSCKSYLIQINSLIVAAKARYSALAEDRATVVCFLAFQEIKDSPKKMQNPVTKRLKSVDDA